MSHESERYEEAKGRADSYISSELQIWHASFDSLYISRALTCLLFQRTQKINEFGGKMHVDFCCTVFEMYPEVISGLFLCGSKMPCFYLWKIMAKTFGAKAPSEKTLINGWFFRLMTSLPDETLCQFVNIITQMWLDGFWWHEAKVKGSV